MLHPVITLAANNRNNLCSYYVQLSATLREQLRTIVDNIMRLLTYVIHKDMTSLHVATTASVASQSREILPGSTTHQGIDGHFYVNVVYPDI